MAQVVGTGQLLVSAWDLLKFQVCRRLILKLYIAAQNIEDASDNAWGDIMKQNSILAVVMAAVSLMAGSASAAIIYDNGAPNQLSAWSTEPVTSMAQPFTLNAGATITGVNWWGTCAFFFTGLPGTTCPTGDFTVAFYTNSGGFPGSLVASYGVGSAGQTATGLFINSIYPEYSYSASIPSLMLAPGRVLAVSI